MRERIVLRRDKVQEAICFRETRRTRPECCSLVGQVNARLLYSLSQARGDIL